MMHSLLLVLLAASPCFAEKRYDGYQVLRMDLKPNDIEVMKKIENSPDTDFLDFLRDVMVAPSQLDKIKGMLDSNGIQYSVLIDDVQGSIETQFSSRRSRDVDRFDYSVYHNYDEIHQWVLNTARQFPHLASSIVLTESYQGRPLDTLLVGKPSKTPKEAIWIQGGANPAEWMSPSVVMWMANQLLEDYSTDSVVKAMLDRFDIYVLPLLNADGYVYTWTNTRFWMKTRSLNKGSRCVGTDVTRNWDIRWADATQAEKHPCSNFYHGSSPNSEPEVKGIVNFIEETSITKTFRMFLDVRHYYRYWLFPYGYDADTYSADYTEQYIMARSAIEGILSVHGNRYLTAPYRNFNPTCGLSQDWAYDVANITYSYTVYLGNRYGDYLIPEDKIIPTSEDTYGGLKGALRYLMSIS
ncbi:carboxypeptidase B-like [Ptychodera flava]|uniref:carboxypeptidase B-like n=1 Tax=Ptychodera flava TaxID=63121 RepID=UPI003969C73B